MQYFLHKSKRKAEKNIETNTTGGKQEERGGCFTVVFSWAAPTRARPPSARCRPTPVSKSTNHINILEKLTEKK